MTTRPMILGVLGSTLLFALAALVLAILGSSVPVWLLALLALASAASLALGIQATAAIASLAAMLPAAREGALSPSQKADFAGDYGILASGLAELSECLNDSRSHQKEKDKAMEAMRRASEEAVAQAREASRLAEKSRADYLLSAATKLDNVVGRVMASAGELSNEMERISDGADIQRQRMLETSSAMGEMNMAIGDISRSSSDASVSVEHAKEQAGHSARIVAEAITAIGKVNEATTALKHNMTSLGEKASSIDQVINMINDIADQTNLLALNAAIEAARAGDAGRGFAVVADEVRKLAEKTMTATKEVGASITAIQQSIHGSVEQMELAAKRTDEAAAMARKSGDSAQDILRFAEDNTLKIHAIATASEEQSASSVHISKAIEETEKVARSISEGIHESTRAVLELSTLSKELSQLVADLKSGMSADTLMPWNSALATGVKIIDQQHKQLVDMINKLYTAMKSGQGKRVVEKLLDDLAAYTVKHFDTEEKYFEQFGYKETAAHKKIHTDLKATVMDFIDKFKSGKADVSMELMNFLRDWLAGHIQKTDMRYAKLFLDKGLERS